MPGMKMNGEPKSNVQPFFRKRRASSPLHTHNVIMREMLYAMQKMAFGSSHHKCVIAHNSVELLLLIGSNELWQSGGRFVCVFVYMCLHALITMPQTLSK